MAGVCTVMLIASAPGQTVVVSQFNTAFREALGLSASALSGAYLVGTVAAALPLVLLGRASDRFGPRAVTAAVAVFFGLACGAAGLAQGIVTLTIAFFFLRFLGQGGLSLLSGHALALWFERRLGTVNGLKLMGAQLGFAIIPGAVIVLIDSVGWRLAYPLLGVGVWVAVIPLLLLVAKDRPEQVGQRLDGDPMEQTPALDAPAAGDDSDGPAATMPPETRREIAPTGRRHLDPAFTLAEAKRTGAYWILAATIVLNGMIGTALIFHAQPLLEMRGLDPALSATVVRTWSLVVMLTIFPAGWIADRLPPRVLLPGAMLLICGASALSAAGASTAYAHAAMGAYGLSQSLIMGVGVPTVARYFGRAHHGAIRGSMTRLAVAGTGLGPLALGASLDLTGSFWPGLAVFAALSAVVGALAVFLRRPA